MIQINVIIRLDDDISTLLLLLLLDLIFPFDLKERVLRLRVRQSSKFSRSLAQLNRRAAIWPGGADWPNLRTTSGAKVTFSSVCATLSNEFLSSRYISSATSLGAFESVTSVDQQPSE